MPPTENRPFDITVVGEINPDIILQGDVVPIFGQVEKTVESGALRIGSSSVIFACGAAQLGLRVQFIGKVGADAFGRFMLDAMRERGIDTGQVTMDKQTPTGFSVILSTGDDRAILTYPGLIPELQFSDIDLDALAKASHLHIGSYYMLDKLRPDMHHLFAAARAAGLTISLDTNYDPHEAWDEALLGLLPSVDVLLVNEVEAKAISGCHALDDALIRLAGIVPTVVVKCGAEGAVARQGSTQGRVSALSVKVVDTVGAGDSFDAGYIYGTLAGWSLDCCLHLGACCGSLSTQKAGGTSAQPTLQEARQALPVLAGCGS